MFLFKFLPVTLFAYYVAPSKLKNLVLLIASLFFYAWGEPKYIFIMFISTFLDFFVGLGIERFRGRKNMCRFFLVLSVFFNLSILFFFKYTDFFIENANAALGVDIKPLALTLPLGVSFYTFQTMSYSIDVYRGEVKAEKNIIRFGAFVCLFPQLIAGPIVKYRDINEELRHKKLNSGMLEDGVRLFIMGLGSKVLIANNVGMIWNDISEKGISEISSPMAWLAILAFSLQIYFDFSGYSLMAIGLGKLLGFEFPQNFNYPYISRSVTEFWRRWHMTLGSWFREYLYFPLGGSRRGNVRTVLNLFVVWLATGFWHGASWNFVIWGLFYFVLIMLEKLFLGNFLQRHRVFSHIYLLLAVMFGWVIFAIDDIHQIPAFLSKLFSFDFSGDIIYYLRNYSIVVLAACLFCTPVLNRFYGKIKRHKVITACLLFAVLFLSVAYLVDSTYNPFLYFRF